jgi:hypothetical protein
LIRPSFFLSIFCSFARHSFIVRFGIFSVTRYRTLSTCILFRIFHRISNSCASTLFCVSSRKSIFRMRLPPSFTPLVTLFFPSSPYVTADIQIPAPSADSLITSASQFAVSLRKSYPDQALALLVQPYWWWQSGTAVDALLTYTTPPATRNTPLFSKTHSSAKPQPQMTL